MRPKTIVSSGSGGNRFDFVIEEEEEEITVVSSFTYFIHSFIYSHHVHSSAHTPVCGHHLWGRMAWKALGATLTLAAPASVSAYLLPHIDEGCLLLLLLVWLTFDDHLFRLCLSLLGTDIDTLFSLPLPSFVDCVLLKQKRERESTPSFSLF